MSPTLRTMSLVCLLPLLASFAASSALAQTSGAAPVDDEPSAGRSLMTPPDFAPRQPAVAPLSPVAPQAVPAPLDLVAVGITTTSNRLRHATLGFQSCKLPCTVFVSPGLQPLLVSGATQLLTHVDIGRFPTRIRLRDWTRYMNILGGSLTAAGGVVATSFWAFGLESRCQRGNGCFITNVTFWPITGFFTFMAGVGILGYSGTHPEPEAIVEPVANPRADRPRLIGLQVGPSESGATAAAAFSF